MDDFFFPSKIGLHRRLIQVFFIKCLPLRLLLNKGSNPEKEFLPDIAKTLQQLRIGVVHNLIDFIFCNIAVPQNQSVRPCHHVMLVKLILILLTQLILHFFLCSNIMVIHINPRITAITLDNREFGINPDIIAVSLFQPVLQLVFLTFLFDTLIQICLDIFPVIRMNAGQGIVTIDSPCLILRHIQHLGKTL